MFKQKVGANGSVERYKARVIAQEFSQKFGFDYSETFCIVVHFESVRTIIVLAILNSLKMHQLDVSTAFLNGELNETILQNNLNDLLPKAKSN